jgi:predicted N-acyltransferase
VLKTQVITSLSEVAPAAWDALVGPEDPFMEHAFLALLERSGSVGRGTGWLPMHIIATKDDVLCGALPLYLKQHSFGEFIFDFAWAHAAMRAGLSYYPKLVSAAPLTPVTGDRLLVRSDVARASVVEALTREALDTMRRTKASSLHVLFASEQNQQELSGLGLHARFSYQFHWQSQGYRTFDDFLAALRNSSRKQVRKERERARSHGLTLSMRNASELSSRDWDAMWNFYNATIDEKGSTAYLTEAFFRGLTELRTAYVAMAHDGDTPVAGALFFYKGTSLYGRYWGQTHDLPMLHFELCYYLPMQWGIARGMQRFEAGAQGEHKIKRGFLPARCFSAHRMAHPGLDRAVAEFVAEEARGVNADIALLSESTPFRRE